MESSVPNSIDYSKVRPLAVPQGNDIITIQPLGSFNSTFTLNDSVRFQFQGNFSKGGKKMYADPLNIFFELQTSIPTTTLANDATFSNKVVQLDQSAYSHFRNIVFYAPDGSELSRINDVCLVANTYKDMNFDPWDRKTHEYQGFGGAIIDECSRNVNCNPVGGFNPTTVPPGGGNPTYLQNGNPNPAYTYKLTDCQEYNKCFWHPLKDNYHYFAGANGTGAGVFIPWTPEWGMGPNQSNICTQNIIAATNFMAPQTWYAQADFNNYNGGDMYATTAYNNAIANYPMYSNPQVNGIEYPFHPNFVQTNFEPRFSSTVPQRVMSNGVPVNSYVTTQFWIIPWFEGLGQLMEYQNYKLIPLKMLHGTIIEVWWNQFAYFTSWYSTNVTNRYFNINSFQLRARVMWIEDEAFAAMIDASVDRGFRIITRSVYTAPVVTVASGVPPSSVQYNLGFDSLRRIDSYFCPTDHTKSTSCREQKRLSFCVTSLQYEFLYDYYPNQPLTGNTGSNSTYINNSEFFDSLMDAWGKQYSLNGQTINPHNYAINYYENDPTSADTNLTGAPQLGFYLENSTIGKCLLSIEFRGLDKDRGVISGLNTRDVRPWNVNLEYDTSVPYPRTAYYRTQIEYDCIYEWDGSNITCKGKA